MMTISDQTSEKRTQGERSPSAEQALRLACQCARVCEAFRGTNTVVLDLREVTPIFDFFVMTTGSNRRQMHAIAEEVDHLLTAHGSSRHGLEGYRESTWIVEDYGDIVLHVFNDETRELYDLESLWADAKTIDWDALAEPWQPSEKQRRRQFFSTVDEGESTSSYVTRDPDGLDDDLAD